MTDHIWRPSASALNRPADIRIKSENKANGRNKTQRPVGATRHFH
jgi:hypothetical protein